MSFCFYRSAFLPKSASALFSWSQRPDLNRGSTDYEAVYTSFFQHFTVFSTTKRKAIPHFSGQKGNYRASGNIHLPYGWAKLRNQLRHIQFREAIQPIQTGNEK